VVNPTEYIVTIRLGLRDDDNNLVAGQAGVDALLTTTSKGHLVFPHDIFVSARDILIKEYEKQEVEAK